MLTFYIHYIKDIYVLIISYW